MDWGFSGMWFGFRHLIRIRTSGKKATRPCPCGWLGHTSGRCRCAPEQVARYRGRVSGPLIDRLDLAIEVPSVPAEALALSRDDANPCERSADVRARVECAHAQQCARQ